MFCRRCWTLLDANASYCARCGELYVQEPEEGRVDVFLVGFEDAAARQRFLAYLTGMAQEAAPERLGALADRLPTAFMRGLSEEMARPLVLHLSSLGARLYVRRTGEDGQAREDGAPARRGPLRRRRAALARLARRLGRRNARTLYAGLLLVTAAVGAFVLYRVSRYESPFEAALREKDARERTVGTHFPLILKGAREPLPVEGFLPLPPGGARLRSRGLNAGGLEAYREGNYGAALGRFDDALRADPTNEAVKRNVVSALTELGRECYERGDLDGAMHHLQRALELEPERAAAMKWLGLVYYRLDLPDRAARLLAASLAYEPRDAEVHWLLAEIAYDADDVAGAVVHMRDYLRLDPENREARVYLRRIDREAVIERNMETLSNERFLVKFDGEANYDSGRLVLDGLERAYRKLARDLEFEPERPITALLYADRRFEEVIRAPDWTGALFDGKIRIPLGGIQDAPRGEVERLVLHEYTHAAVHQMAKGNCPAWLNEGLALYQSEQDAFNQKAMFRFRVKHKAGDVLALEEMAEGFLGFDEAAARAAYNEAYNVAAYLVAVYGYSEVRRLLLAFGAGRSAEQAVLEVLGVPFDEFEGAFQRYVFHWEE